MKYVDAATTAEKISDKFNIPMAELVDVFAEIPAADVQPVEHGEWRKDDNTHYRCTACLNFLVSKGNARFYDYCPNCGARMDFKDCDTDCPKCGARMDGDTNGT